MKRALLGFIALLLFVTPGFALAQDATGSPAVEQEYLEKATVLEASASSQQQLAGTDISTKVQEVKVQVLEGPDKGALA
jgi:uncharacterized membrane protein